MLISCKQTPKNIPILSRLLEPPQQCPAASPTKTSSSPAPQGPPLSLPPSPTATNKHPSSGVGLETTILMLREGASVLMTDVSAPAPPRSPTRPHGRAWTPSSSTWPSRPTSRARSTGSRRGAAWGGVDAVFNNAGIMDPGDGDDASDEVWARTLAVNVKGVWYGSKHAVRGMREAGKRKGSVVNTASVVALVGSATAQVAYTASKGAVLALTRELAVVHARGKVSSVVGWGGGMA